MIEILEEESHFLAVNKPAGLLTQAAEGIASLQSRLTHQLRDRDNHPGTPFIGLPHRLDRGTSGVVLVARNQRALKRFGQQFQSRKIGKFYLAVVEGMLANSSAPSATGNNTNHNTDASLIASPLNWEDSVDWSDYVRKIVDQPQGVIADKDSGGARLAELSMIPLVCCEGVSLCAVRLITGRMHQIRIQFASRGHPVCGDSLYGARQDPSCDKTASGSESRLAGLPLHALRLEFHHPQNGKRRCITAPLPKFPVVDSDLHCEALDGSLPATWANLPTRVLETATAFVELSRKTSSISWNPS